MSSDPQRLKHLFKKYLYDNGTPEEVREFWKLFSELEENDPLKQDLWQLWNELNDEDISSPLDWRKTLKGIHKQAAEWEKNSSVKLKRKLPVWRIAAAAAVLCLLVIGGYVISGNNDTEKQVAQTKSQPVKKDIKPGSNKAVLILTNGKTIFLDSVNQGQLAIQGNSKVTKINKGLLAYNRHLNADKSQKVVQYNTLKTPRGGKYQLVLPDGSKVWLNASSSIRFPTAFIKNERKVEVTGEAYFEIVANVNKPFNVKTGDVEIDVLGTTFNVNAYKDEPVMRVTLLNGSVKITGQTTQQSKLLQPGQQARISSNNDINIVGHVNTNKVIAWKNDLFWFDDDDIHTVMHQISRWYDVDVEIKGEIPQHFTGSIPRNLMVSDVFEVLKRTKKIQFKIEDKKIIVSPIKN